MWDALPDEMYCFENVHIVGPEESEEQTQFPVAPEWEVHSDVRSGRETNKGHQWLWGFISSPGDNPLESYLGFSVQFFALAVLLARLCLNERPRPCVAREWEMEELHQRGRSDDSVKTTTLRGPTLLAGWEVAVPSHRRSSLGTRRPLPKLQGIGLEFAKTAVGRDGVVVKRSQWISCYQKQSFRMSTCFELRRKSLKPNQIIKRTKMGPERSATLSASRSRHALSLRHPALLYLPIAVIIIQVSELRFFFCILSKVSSGRVWSSSCTCHRCHLEWYLTPVDHAVGVRDGWARWLLSWAVRLEL